jgi:hydroxymethylbilane synthase
VLVARDGRSLAQLPPGSRIGTGSPRRAAQLRALGLGLEVVDIRGNVDTRVRMVSDGVVDGVLLARAGLLRLGRGAEVTQVLDTSLMLPAPGQGALAAEARADDLAVLAALACVDDLVTRACVTAERALLARLEAGCAAPVGALAAVRDGDRLVLEAAVGAVDGSIMLRRSAAIPFASRSAPGASAGTASAEAPSTEAVALGEALAGDLLAGGAASLIPDGLASGRADPSAPAREGEP